MVSHRLILPGDTAPGFRAPSMKNPSYNFDQAAGRYLVMAFFVSARFEGARTRLIALRERTDLFNDDDFSFFGVTTDPDDFSQPRIAESYPGYRYFLDSDLRISKLYGAARPDGADDTIDLYTPAWVILDPSMRVLKTVPFQDDMSDLDGIFPYLESLPLPPSTSAGLGVQAPILVLPQIFEPGFCDYLIGLYRTNGGQESGYMIEREGKTIPVLDQSHKRRQDYTITDPDIIRQTNARISRRVIPQIFKVHQFEATKIERHIVAHYGADTGGHFRAHRDNTTPGTAHRQFALSINLNDDFDGGEVSFPEYGSQSYKAPAGGAVVFSCALLHQVSPVTRGSRFAFLPFLYNDEAGAVRRANAASISSKVDGSVEAPEARAEA